ncbi:MAG: ParB N-terminal domain-containing protein [Nitrososphaeria archaeon]|nr:ParB N-terminal domain-containing protein [Nitrososphaeria archaeon]
MSYKKVSNKISEPSTFLLLKPILVNIDLLKAHEDVDTKYCEELRKIIEADRVIKKPIVADINTYTILDGHHRVSVLKSLGCKLVPTLLVDYNSPMIILDSWKSVQLDKRTVILYALEGKRFPPKTTKHMIQINGKLKHISFIQKDVNLPLDMLK